MSESARGRTKGRRAGPGAHARPIQTLLPVLTLALTLLLGPSPSTADFIAFPGRFAPRGAPPILLARSHPVVPVPARVLSASFIREQYRHSSSALEASDPAIAALAGARVARNEIELGYGLGHHLTARARIGWASLKPGSGGLTPADGGSEGGRVGFEDLHLALSRSTGILNDRITARAEAGISLPTGDDSAYQNSSGQAWTPFTRGDRVHFGGGAVTLALSRSASPVAVHLHAEGTFVDGSTPAGGMASAPFPERLPLLVLGPQAHDRVDLRFALVVSRPGAVLFGEVELPLLLDAGDLLAPQEAPSIVSPGFAIRLSVLDFGAQLDLPLAGNDADTAFDPHLAYPDWGFRLRLGTDLLPVDRDRDQDGVGDRTDRCPGDPEDRDGHADRDGCPDPDNDGDRIPDSIDSCPNAREDRDAFADEDGCPEDDNDRDGIPDAADLCPNSAEDLDGFADEDGCPEREPDLAEPDLVPEPDLAPEPVAPAPGEAKTP